MNKAIISKIIMASAMATAMVAPVAASAHTAPWRFENQQDRIRSGVASGQLTWREYSHDEAALHKVEAQRRADLRAGNGSLTSAQRAQLQHELNHNSSRIWFTNHNRYDQRGT